MTVDPKDMVDKVKGALKDEKATDEVLDKVADAAKKATGGKFDEKIDALKAEADKKLGSE